MSSLRFVRPAAAFLVLPLALAFTAAVPTASAEPRKTIAQVQDELDALELKAEAASEALNGAQVQLTAIQAKSVVTKKQVAAAQAAVDNQERTAGQLAAEAYRSGGLDASLQLLTADDPQAFLSQATSLQQLARSQNSMMRRTEIAHLALAQAQAQLKQQEASAAEQVKSIAEQRAQINAAVNEQQQILGQLQEEQRKQLAALAAAKRAAAAAAAATARRDAAARAARAQRESVAAANPGGSGNSGSGNGGGNGGGGGGYSSGRAAIAVQYALSQVGDPYSYNANPPSSWDCSKLTAAAWAHAGVSLTPYSYAQVGETRRVSTGDLQPGDILFYFNGAHHVAMYIGGGQLVEASSPSTGVRVTSLWNSWSASHFSFAGRPVG